MILFKNKINTLCADLPGCTISHLELLWALQVLLLETEVYIFNFQSIIQFTQCLLEIMRNYSFPCNIFFPPISVSFVYILYIQKQY